MTSKEIAIITNTSVFTVCKWAAENDVAYIGEGKRKTFLWADKDLERYKCRNTARGRPRKESE